MRTKNKEPKLTCSVDFCPNRWVIYTDGKALCREHADADPKDWHAITAYNNRKKLLAPVRKDQWYDKE